MFLDQNGYGTRVSNTKVPVQYSWLIQFKIVKYRCWFNGSNVKSLLKSADVADWWINILMMEAMQKSSRMLTSQHDDDASKAKGDSLTAEDWSWWVKLQGNVDTHQYSDDASNVPHILETYQWWKQEEGDCIRALLVLMLMSEASRQHLWSVSTNANTITITNTYTN